MVKTVIERASRVLGLLNQASGMVVIYHKG